MNARAVSLARTLRTDLHPTTDYRVCRSADDIASYLDDYSPPTVSLLQNDRLTIAEDTESLPGGSPYCVTFSILPGTARLIYVYDTHTLSAYRNFLSCYPTHQVFHNYLHDCVPFADLSLPINKFSDTMVRAYHLCLGGGGDDEDSESKAGRGSLSLKVLAYRLLNMRMTSFRDTVFPHSVPQLAQWLSTAAQYLTPASKQKVCGNCGCLQSTHETRGKTQRRSGPCTACGNCRKYAAVKKPPKPTEEAKSLTRLYTKSSKLAHRLLHDTTTDWADSKKDPWKLVNGWSASDVETLTLLAGPQPVPSVEHVPEPELIAYACRDADATLRLHLLMRTLKPWLFWRH